MQVRAFLHILSRSNEWETTVHREFRTLRASWLSHLDCSSETKRGLLHVGFEQIELDSLISTLAEFPNNLLITEAARWSLPQFNLHYAGPISPTDVEAQDQLLYVITKGWGYEIDATNLNINFKPKENMETCSYLEITDWLEHLIPDHIGILNFLQQKKIYSDVDYLIHQASLPVHIQTVCDTIRYDYYCHGVKENDLDGLLEIAPLWLLMKPASHVASTVRLSNVFIAAGFLQVQDIKNHGGENLFNLKNYGRTSHRDLLKAIKNALSNGPQSKPSKMGTLSKSFTESYNLHNDEGFNERHASQLTEEILLKPLRQHLDETFAQLPQRKKEILTNRLGTNNRPRTLQQIANDQGISRERVRQIESKVSKDIISACYWDDVLRVRLASLFTKRREPLFLDMAEAEDPWFEGFGNRPNYLGRIIKYFASKHYHCLNIRSRVVLARIAAPEWNDLLLKSKLISRDCAKSRTTKYQWKLSLESLADQAGAIELLPVIAEEVGKLLHFSDEDDENSQKIIALSENNTSLVLSIVRNSAVPIHYEDVRDQILSKTGIELSARSTHIALQNSNAILLGSGKFGVAKHILIGKDNQDSILQIAEELITDGPNNRQWHTYNILAEITDQIQFNFELTTYILNFILGHSSILKPLGRNLWMSSDGQRNDDLGRIAIAQAIPYIIQTAGRPLTTNELLLHLKKKRGIHKAPQMPCPNGVIRLTNRMWGLSSRDLGLSHEQQDKYLDALERVLLARNKGLHESELITYVSTELHFSITDTDQSGLFTLTRHDRRFSFGYGRYLGLSSWEGTRRISISEATETVLEHCNSPFHMDVVRAEIAKVAERPDVIERNIANLLSSYGCSFSEQLNKWIPPVIANSPAAKP